MTSTDSSSLGDMSLPSDLTETRGEKGPAFLAIGLRQKLSKRKEHFKTVELVDWNLYVVVEVHIGKTYLIQYQTCHWAVVVGWLLGASGGLGGRTLGLHFSWVVLA